MKKNIINKVLCGAFTAILALTTHLATAANLAAGKAKAETCAACHGTDGNSASPNFPRLAGQNEDYLVVALKSYKNGKRNNPIMKGMAESLSKDDMENLAAYFASQPGLQVKR